MLQDDSINRSKRGALMNLVNSIASLITMAVLMFFQLTILVTINKNNRDNDNIYYHEDYLNNSAALFEEEDGCYNKTHGLIIMLSIVAFSAMGSYCYLSNSLGENLKWNPFALFLLLVISSILFFILFAIYKVIRNLITIWSSFSPLAEELPLVCGLFFMELLFSISTTILFPILPRISNYDWLYYLIEIPILIWTLYELTIIVISISLDAMKEDMVSSYRMIFRTVVASVVIQICLLSLIMYNGLVVSYELNTNSAINNHYFEFSDNLDDSESLLGIFIKDDVPISVGINTNETGTIRRPPLLLKSFYFVIITFTSVGYGDIVPYSALAKLFSMFVSLYGYIMAAMIIGTIMGVRFSPPKKSEDIKQQIEYKNVMRALVTINKHISALQTNEVKPANPSPDGENHDTKDNENDIVWFG